jgi:hypothetical protein
MDTRRALIERIIPFLEETKNRTAGTDFEGWLNAHYGPGTSFYEDVSRYIRAGVEEGWAANIEVNGPNLRRSQIAEPSAETNYFSITAVYMNGQSRVRGRYHAHPYGELNMVVPIDPDAQLSGPNGWSGPGWTAPEPASHHYPEARNGALITLAFLPAGRISYDIEPPSEPDAAA